MKIIYKDKIFKDGDYRPIKTYIKYMSSDLDGIELKLLIGKDVASYVRNLRVRYPFKSDPKSYENRMNFHSMSSINLKKLYDKLIIMFSKKEYSYEETKDLLEIISGRLNPKTEENIITIEDIFNKIPETLLSNDIKEYIEENFDDLFSYFDDLFDPEKLILKSPNDLADYFKFVYDVTNNNELNITEWGEYFRKYYSKNMQ